MCVGRQNVQTCQILFFLTARQHRNPNLAQVEAMADDQDQVNDCSSPPSNDITGWVDWTLLFHRK